MFRSLLSLPALATALLTLLTLGANAQVGLSISTSRDTYLAYENVPVTITITNLSGRDLTLRNNDRDSWLSFTVTNTRQGRRLPLNPGRTEFFRPVEIPAGKQVTKTINLSNFYPLASSGTYSIRANVFTDDGRGGRRSGNVSNGATINVVDASDVWTQPYGVPDGYPGARNQRLYRLKLVTVGKTTDLFARVDDQTTGRTLSVTRLGRTFSFAKPSAMLDDEQNLHVLFQNNGNIYVHFPIYLDGRKGIPTIYKRVPNSLPKLIKGENGRVGVLGGLVFDPAAEAAEKARIRKVSERPAVRFR